MTITVEGPGGATVEFPDGTSADTINSVMSEQFGGAKKNTPSGVSEGAKHGVSELINGPAETLKRFAGVGPGRKDDPNYVPANVSNGSFDPRDWNYSQLPQKIAELTPSVGEAALGAGAGAKIGGAAGKRGKLLGGLVGAMVPNLFNTAGDTAREVTAARTGNPDAESSTADLVRGGATAGAASLANAVLPTRLAPGFLKPGNVGGKGVAEGLANYLGTTALGGAGAVAGDAITQAGTTGTIDTSRFPEAMVGGLAAGATLASPKLLGDTVRAGSNAKFGGDNAEPMANYATRLQTHGEALGGLGNKKRDATAHELVKTDLRNELGDAAKAAREQLGRIDPDADNALQRAQNGDTVTKADVELIKNATAGAPDGANAAFLAHTLRMAQLAQGRGNFSEKSWAGGLSGAMEKSVGYMLNPMRLAGGGIATYAIGLNPLGLMNPNMAGAIAAGYGGARVLDSATGMRSPAKSFAEHFADQNAQLRKPTTPQAAPPPAPPAPPGPVPRGPWNPAPPAPAYGPTGAVTGTRPAQQAPWGPWGPRPLPTTSVPPVAPPAPPPAITPGTLPWAKPQVNELWNGPNPLALSMLKDKLKAGPPAAPAPPPAPAPEMWKGLSPIAAQMLARQIKETTASANAPPPAPKAPWASPQVSDITPPPSNDVPKGVTANAKKLMTGIAKANKLKERADAAEAKAKATAERDAKRAAAAEEKMKATKLKAALKASKASASPASLNSAASPKTMADILAAVTEEAVPKPKKITKKNGKVEAEEADASYAPFAEEHLYPKGITPKDYATREAAAKGTRSETYMAKAEASETRRAGIAADLKSKHPKAARAIDWLHRELQKTGINPKEIARVVKFAQENVTDDVAQAMEAFKK